MPNKIMRVLGIDPGYEKLGIAVIEKGNNKHDVIYSECFRTDKNLPHEVRLQEVLNKMRSIIKEFNPEVFGIETLFLTTNHKTVMKVSEARGVILSSAAEAGIKIRELSPPSIKLSICSNGKADKKAIMKMIPLLAELPHKPKEDDEYDAIAIGLATLALEKSF